MKNYFEQVKEDVKVWIEDNKYFFDLDEYRGKQRKPEMEIPRNATRL